MNKNVLIIGGSIAILGVGAYLYFKGKGKPKEETMGAGETGTTGTTGTGMAMPPAGSVFTTPEEVEAITVKVSTARDLTKTICDLKKQYKITEDEINDFMNFTGVSAGIASSVNSAIFGSTNTGVSVTDGLKFQLARKKAIPTIAESINKLKELGYKEVDCKMVKIA
jgi:hypothetical protein